MIVLAAPGAALAQAPVTPTTFLDGNDESCTPQHCTLREALGDFNLTTINLLPGTYELSEHQPIVMRNVKTINGAGATIDGNNQSGVLFLQETTDAIINDVTITGGNADAGQSFAQSGGGIYVQNPSTLQLNRSTVSGNHAGLSGGGIYNESGNSVVINNSTIAGNTAGSAGSGGEGAGIYADSSSDMDVVNSTISGNRLIAGRLADGAGLLSLGILDLVHVTMAANVPVGDVEFGGPGNSLAIHVGQFPSAAVSIWNTIVAAETGAACSITRTTTGDHNLDDDGSCGFSRFGDKPGVNPLLGPLGSNGGATATHALGAGSPAINGGDGPHCIGADQRGIARPQLGACDIGAFEYVPPPPPPPPPPVDEEQPLPPPEIRKTVNVQVKSDTVRVRRRGQRRFVKLTEGQQIPVGSTIDTLKGRVTLTAAADNKGKTATADFYAGIFKVGQTKGSKPTTTLKLTERLTCPKRGKASAAAKKKKRRLWGNGRGKFRTEGSYSAATVRGTIWLTEDRCTSTRTKVTRGSVTVRDKVKKKKIIVRRGKQYIARARR